MKKIYLTSIFCICAAFHPAFAIENPKTSSSCSEFKYNTRLNLTTSYGKLDYNHTYNQQSLTNLGQKYGLIGAGMYASGLSLTGIDWYLRLNTVARIASDDSVCVLPTSIDVFIGFQNPTIYISNSLPKGSCQYNLALRHEHQHQQVNIAALDYFIPQIKIEIEKKLKEVKPQSVKSLSQTDQITLEMNDEYTAIVEPLIDRFKATLLYEQKKLDNLNNYRFESAICRSNKK